MGKKAGIIIGSVIVLAGGAVGGFAIYRSANDGKLFEREWVKNLNYIFYRTSKQYEIQYEEIGKPLVTVGVEGRKEYYNNEYYYAKDEGTYVYRNDKWTKIEGKFPSYQYTKVELILPLINEYSNFKFNKDDHIYKNISPIKINETEYDVTLAFNTKVFTSSISYAEFINGETKYKMNFYDVGKYKIDNFPSTTP